MSYNILNYKEKRDILINATVSSIALNLAAKCLQEEHKHLTKDDALQIVKKVLFEQAKEAVNVLTKKEVNQAIYRINRDSFYADVFCDFTDKLSEFLEVTQ